MALSDEQPVWSVTFLDASGTTTTSRGSFAAGYEATDYLDALQDLVGLFSGVSDCAITRYAVTFRKKESDPGTPRSALPPPSQARLVFQLATDPLMYETVLIPLKPEWVFTDGPLAGFGIDIDNLDVYSIGAEISTGLYCNPFDDDIGDLISGHVETTL